MKPNSRRAMTLAAAFCLIAAAAYSPAQSPAAPPLLRILVSNDDGIEAPGLAAVVKALARVGQVTVAAPAKNSSGTSHGVTSQVEIRFSESVRDGVRWIGVEALPATCVRLGLEALLPEKPDVVVSGINRGENLGVITFYSATVAAAREAALAGVSAISVNMTSGPTMDYGPGAEFTASLAALIGRRKLPAGVFLNVNVPNLPKDKIRGARLARQDTQPSIELFEKRTGADGAPHYWNTYRPLEPVGTGTDVWAVRNGYIAITPMTIDQTAGRLLKDLAGWGFDALLPRK